MSLTRLPARWVALAVEAGDYHNPMFLHLEEKAIREAAHSCAAGAPVNERELQRVLRERLNRSCNCQCETLAKLQANVGITRASSKSSLASGIHTTGSVTVSEIGET